MDWRKIEQALVGFAKSEGLMVDEDTKTGDKLVYCIHQDTTKQTTSLTELAKELAERLA